MVSAKKGLLDADGGLRVALPESDLLSDLLTFRLRKAI